MEPRREKLFGQLADPDVHAGLLRVQVRWHQAPPPFLGRSFDGALKARPGVVAVAASLDLSAAVFLGFLASRFDFRRSLAMLFPRGFRRGRV
jgi:hypothetical protein